jgi:cell wall-associated NlpC family hydrolase
MQAALVSIDSRHGRRHGRRARRQSRARISGTRQMRVVELACALLLALCIVGLNLAGSARAATQGEAIVNAAASMHGKPYCEDGGSPTSGPTHGSGGEGCESKKTVGFDCSGLALYAVYQGTGGKVNLPHKASWQAQPGVQVERGVVVPSGQVIRHESELQPGDLVFFGGGSMAKAQHVGIYAGGGVMWDANDNNVPVQQHKLSWEEKGRYGLPFDGGVRYWSAGSAPASPGPGSPGSSGSPSPGASGELAPSPTPSEPPSTGTPAPPAPTYAETSGSVVHTWTDYSDAGGNEGPEMPSNDTVQIACKINGFTVADGNTWWYRIASAPWSGNYYGSADAFYNNGETSGSLKGTPFVDPNVPTC